MTDALLSLGQFQDIRGAVDLVRRGIARHTAATDISASLQQLQDVLKHFDQPADASRLTSASDEELESSILACQRVKDACDDHFRTDWKQVRRRWRELYTDAALLKASVQAERTIRRSVEPIGSRGDSASSSKRRLDDRSSCPKIDPKREEWLLDGIKQLDLAIIVAGVPGRGRRRAVLALIEVLQSLLGESQDKSSSKKHKIEQVNGGSEQHKPPELRAHLPVPELPEPPSLESFLLRHHQAPFVLRNFAADWPALQPCSSSPGRSRWASSDYMLQVAGGRGRIVPCEVGGQYTDEGWGQQMLPWEMFLTRIGWDEQSSPATKDQPMLYLAQHTLFQQFPELEQDIIPPDYVYPSLPAPKHMPEYTAPTKTIDDDDETSVEETVVNYIWLGPKGTVSPAHTDPYFNCYVQVVGKKLIWIAPPFDEREKDAMYCFGRPTPSPPPLSDDEPSGTDRAPHPDVGSSQADDSIDVTSYMSNTSRVDVFSPHSKDSIEDLHPLFTDLVEPQAMWTILEEGDMLFLPPKWWHAVKSLTRSCSVSMMF